MSASLALSPSNAVSVRFAVSHFRYRQSPETSDKTFVQIVQSLLFTTFVILRNPFVIIATTFASHGRSSNYKNGHSKRPIDESRSQDKTRGIFTHSQPAAIILIYITHLIMRSQISSGVSPRGFMTFSAGITGIPR